VEVGLKRTEDEVHLRQAPANLVMLTDLHNGKGQMEMEIGSLCITNPNTLIKFYMHNAKWNFYMCCDTTKRNTNIRTC
jgi:hypothetical protein